jgi:hypothetical protein
MCTCCSKVLHGVCSLNEAKTTVKNQCLAQQSQSGAGPPGFGPADHQVASHLHEIPRVGLDACEGWPREVPVALEALEQQVHPVQVHLHLVLRSHSAPLKPLPAWSIFFTFCHAL